MKSAVAGTLESSDAMINAEPAETGIELDISSRVMNQYGRQIKATVHKTGLGRDADLILQRADGLPGSVICVITFRKHPHIA